jgi:hypothetical protein
MTATEATIDNINTAPTATSNRVVGTGSQLT